MGHLISRAFKRLTQCSSQSRNQPQQQRELPVEQQDQHDQSNRPLVQAIPVGQSIDSAEYAALSSANNTLLNDSQQHNNQENSHREQASNANNDDLPKHQDVEGAVIKIQALVRGHLTRKALKDAHQHSVPPLSALGQSQFDEESLTKNPPNAVFLPSSPLNSTLIESLSQQQATSINKISYDQPTSRSPLESIAEMLETPLAQKEPETSHEDLKLDPQKYNDENKRKKLSALYTKSSSSPSKLVAQTSGSMSPNEVNASIDLDCDLAASASIDIMDHILKPTDRIASVLHTTACERPGELSKSGQSPPKITKYIEEEPGEQKSQVSKQTLQQQDNNHVSTIGTPDSVDSEEAAAIRIQSAFRGYRSRKNSPYRTRSPTSSPASLKRNALRQQEATVLLEEENDSTIAAVSLAAVEDLLVNGNQANRSEERRSSRPRQRDEFPVAEFLTGQSTQEDADGIDSPEATKVVEDSHRIVELGGSVIESVTTSLDELTATTDDTTVREISEVMLDQQVGANAEQSAIISQTGLCEGDRTSELAVIQMGHNGIQLPATQSLSLEINQSESATSARDEPNLSAALEALPALPETINYADELAESNLPPHSTTQPSVGSAETDSSMLGAALSEASSEEAAPAPQPTTDRFKSDDDDEEDKLGEDVSMTTEELESEARRLVDEITRQGEQPFFNQMRAALEDPTTADHSFAENEGVLLDEEEQRAIELESDDIERRDPRGQVSEERAKSPQIRTEEPSFAQEEAVYAIDSSQQEQLVEQADVSNLNVEQPAELGGSGRSSGVCNSSGCGSSSSSLDRDGLEEEEGRIGDGSKQNEANQKRQPAGSSATPIGRNKKRNRNKKKGKKQ